MAKPEWTRHLDSKLLGHFISLLKKGEAAILEQCDPYKDLCALSFLMLLGFDHKLRIEDEFFNHCQPLIDSYERQHSWTDILNHSLGVG